MKLYFTILLSVAAIAIGMVVYSQVDLPRGNWVRMLGPRYGANQVNIVTWINFVDALEKKLKDGKLIQSGNVQVTLVASRDSKIQREVMVVGVSTSEIEKAVTWLSSQPKSSLFEPFRIKFYESKFENFAEGRKEVMYPLRTLVFESGKFVEKPLYDDEPIGTILDMKKQ